MYQYLHTKRDSPSLSMKDLQNICRVCILSSMLKDLSILGNGAWMKEKLLKDTFWYLGMEGGNLFETRLRIVDLI